SAAVDRLIKPPLSSLRFRGSADDSLSCCTASMYLPSLILMVLFPPVASGVVPLQEHMSTHVITLNSIAHPKDKEATPFYDALAKALKKRKTKIDNLCPPSDPVARRILEEYGAIFLA